MIEVFARVIQVDVLTDKMDAGIQGVETALKDVITKVEGFAGAILLVERTASKALYMTLYESQEAADAVMQSGVSQDVISKLSEFMAGTPSIEGYEVALKV